MESLESLDKECSSLGGLFQQVVNDMKNGVPHYEDLVNKAAKLHSQLKSTIMVLASFLDTFQKIADAATNTKGASKDIGACLTRIVLRHKSMESRMKTLCGALLECMVLPLQDKLEDWKKTVVVMDKDHAKEYKKLRSDVKKKWEAANRLHKKSSKQQHKNNNHHQPPSGGDQLQKAVDASVTEVSKQLQMLQETEKAAVRKALIEERSRYCSFVSCLKPVLSEEGSLVSEFQQLEEITKKLAKHTEEPTKLPPASEQVISDMMKGTADGDFSFRTPPSSPSSLGSRKSSMCSISSAGSSNGSPSHRPSSRTLPHSQNNPASALGPMMRLSSVSSQDSGFTSQDTLFPRPGSPSRKNMANGGGGDQRGRAGPVAPGGENVLTDRPHTISSAYEKGHQRPHLQPYTFTPPGSTLTIPEADTEYPSSVASDLYGSQDLPPPPPPRPQVCPVAPSSSDQHGYRPPSLPGKASLAATMDAAKQQQALQQYRQHHSQMQNVGPAASNVPNFHCNKQDMIVPQPVYMNTNDLAAVRQKKQLEQMAQHQQQCSPGADDAQELKTPTAEDNLIIPEQKAGDGGSSTSDSSLGSSSGYGSQSTVRVEDQPQPGFAQPSFRSDCGQRQQQQQQQTTTDGPRVPLPAPLLVDAKYRSLSLRQPGLRCAPCNEIPRHFDRSQSLSDGSAGCCDPTRSSAFPNRPYFYASGAIAEGDGGQLGTLNPTATLRRNGNWQRPPPPTRRTSSVTSESEPPPPPAPAPHVAHDGNDPGSNSTTPRGSLENLPPPPPDLLYSDDDLDATVEAKGKDHRTLIKKRTVSVAESIRALQEKGHTPCSPKGLRRAHSVAAGNLPPQNRPRVNNPREQIYAPVAHLQQRMSQQRQVQEGERYGFGIQFQQHQTQFFHHHQQQHFPPPQPGGYNDYQNNHQPGSHHLQHGPIDQIMGDVDPNLRQRPQPPPLHHRHHHLSMAAGGCDAQTALRVRRWIESKSVTDVKAYRPILNAEIQQGFALRKTQQTNDRSAPRFS